jgi:hypothetical protein
MNPTTLKFFIKEDDRDFPVCHMSEPETAAIGECIDDLLPQTYATTNYWFEVDTCLFDEEDDDQEPIYGLVRCFIHNPKPTNGSLMESRLPHPIPQSVLDSLAGQTFRIQPRQLGLSPWGATIEVTFESAAAPAAAPAALAQPLKPGIKGSDRIAAALKAH